MVSILEPNDILCEGNKNNADNVDTSYQGTLVRNDQLSWILSPVIEENGQTNAEVSEKPRIDQDDHAFITAKPHSSPSMSNVSKIGTLSKIPNYAFYTDRKEFCDISGSCFLEYQSAPLGFTVFKHCRCGGICVKGTSYFNVSDTFSISSQRSRPHRRLFTQKKVTMLHKLHLPKPLLSSLLETQGIASRPQHQISFWKLRKWAVLYILRLSRSSLLGQRIPYQTWGSSLYYHHLRYLTSWYDQVSSLLSTAPLYAQLNGNIQHSPVNMPTILSDGAPQYSTPMVSETSPSPQPLR